MDSVWSTKIQTIEDLKISRDIRFHPVNKSKYLSVLPFQRGSNVLELGCGPGSFTRCLYKWFDGNIEITGLDFDTAFIEYDRQMAEDLHYGIKYINADAVEIPYRPGTFDITTSFTVVEHVDNIPFFKEQYRVLKNNGKIVVMNVAGYNEYTEKQVSEIPVTEEEIELKEEMVHILANREPDSLRKRYAQFRVNDEEKLAALSKCGFQNLYHERIKIWNTPDNPQPEEFSRLVIENFYNNDLYLVNKICNIFNEPEILKKAIRLRELVGERRGKRFALFETGAKIWDAVETDVNILIGTK